jgi:hypothetical protein
VGSLDIDLRPSQPLLCESFELQANSGASNGAGGRSSGTWTTQRTVSGRLYSRTTRGGSSESMQGGTQSDPDVVEIALYAVGVDGSWRVVGLSDGSVFEIVTVTEQPPITFLRVRKVA